MCLTGHVEAEAVFLDLIAVPFGPLIPGSGGGVLLGKKEKLAKALRENLKGRI